MNSNDFLYFDTIKEECEYSKVYELVGKYIYSEGPADTIDKYNNLNVPNRPIWQYWDSGYEDAPIVVKRCIDSVKKRHDLDYILVDSSNLSDYIDFPGYIIDKYNNGLISKTHFSDLVRLELLTNYGGTWIDSTVFLTGLLPIVMIDADCFMFKSSVMTRNVIRASNWFISCKRDNSLLVALKRSLYNFWKENDSVYNYYLFHIMLSRLVDEDKQFMNAFNRIPYFNNSEPHILWTKMNDVYNDENWNWIKERTPVHKLSYKKRFIVGDQVTYYSKLINGELS